MTRFTVVHLHEDRLDETLPLVRMAAPLVTPERWREFACALADGGGGILAAFAGDARAPRVAANRTDESLNHGRTLRVEPLVTFELSQSAPARAALCQALELLAMARGCEHLAIETGSRGYTVPRGAKAAAWAALGFDLDSVGLGKRLRPAPRRLAVDA
jgi:hypothetical protein